LPLTPWQALQELQANPENFLRHHSVRVWGDPGASGLMNFRIHDATTAVMGIPQRPGSVLGNRHTHDTQQFQIRASGSVGVGGPNPPGAVWFAAHSVKMWDVGHPNDIQPYTLPIGGGGSNLMLTGELTGCAFAIHRNPDGSLVVTHIKPHTAGPGEPDSATVHDKPLQSLLQKNDYWHVVYGGKDYDSYNRRVSIVGHRTAAGWKIYAQKLEGLQPFSVRKLTKIF
jgi:hypothetical protein